MSAILILEILATGLALVEGATTTVANINAAITKARMEGRDITEGELQVLAAESKVLTDRVRSKLEAAARQ
jgi:hypothetical protein